MISLIDDQKYILQEIITNEENKNKKIISNNNKLCSINNINILLEKDIKSKRNELFKLNKKLTKLSEYYMILLKEKNNMNINENIMQEIIDITFVLNSDDEDNNNMALNQQQQLINNKENIRKSYEKEENKHNSAMISITNQINFINNDINKIKNELKELNNKEQLIKSNNNQINNDNMNLQEKLTIKSKSSNNNVTIIKKCLNLKDQLLLLIKTYNNIKKSDSSISLLYEICTPVNCSYNHALLSVLGGVYKVITTLIVPNRSIALIASKLCIDLNIPNLQIEILDELPSSLTSSLPSSQLNPLLDCLRIKQLAAKKAIYNKLKSWMLFNGRIFF